MKKFVAIIMMGICISAFSQIDTDQLSLDISKADAANTEQLKAFIWKKASVVTVDGEEKLSVLNEINIDDEGEVNITNIDANTTVKQKRGIRGKVQANAAQGNMDYVEEALKLTVQYYFMSKGQLLDFYGKAEITETDGIIVATGTDIFVKGDKLTLKVESATKLFLHKEFSSMMGEDPINGEVNYGKFKSGVSHPTTSTLNLPEKGAVINSKNKDYVMKVM